MKIKIFKPIIFAFALSLTGCTHLFNSNQLDMAPVEDLNEEKIFSDYNLFRQFADQAYAYVPGHLGRLWNSTTSALTDEARMKDSGIARAFNTGAWDGSSNNPAKWEIIDVYKDVYVGIRKVNTVLNKIGEVPNFPSPEIPTRIVGEMHFLRAFFYFELIKRFGGVVIVPESLNPTENADLPRSSYETCVEYILNDIKQAADVLPEEYPDYDNGRATKGAALALKSRLLLYRARPLHNPENDVQKWQEALDAANDVIEMGIYSLHPQYEKVFFETKHPEIILNRPRKKIFGSNGHSDDGGTFWPRFYMNKNYDGWGGEWVTQNLVDKFEDSEGNPIFELDTDPSSLHYGEFKTVYTTDEKGNQVFDHQVLNPKSNYDPQHPYDNRDPRLAKAIMYHGRQWTGRKVDYATYNGVPGPDRGNGHNNFSYFCIKFWPDGFRRYGGSGTYLDYIYFRYAEILLNFAEALNEVQGPTGTYGSSNMSARDAINQLRDRVGHVHVREDLTKTKEELRERIINERAVELCFEEQRFYDILSLKRGVQYLNIPIRGMEITAQDRRKKKLTFKVFEYYEKPLFKEHMHLYPLPYDEIYKSGGILLQNPGWQQ